MGSAEDSETFYDSLDEEVEQFRSSSPNRVSHDDDGPCSFHDAFCDLPALRTPPNTSRFLNIFDNLDEATLLSVCGRNLTVSPATVIEDMDHLATAFQNLRLEEAPSGHTARSDLHHGHPTRRNVRRSKSCTSLGGKNPNATKKKTASTSKLRLESLTSFKSKCNSYLEMYHRRKNVSKTRKQMRPSPAEDARRRNLYNIGDDSFQLPAELDLAPPPTIRTSCEGRSCATSIHGDVYDNTMYENVGDFRAFPADVDKYMSINLNTDGVEWKPKNVAHRSTSGGRGKHHSSYVPYSIKDYRTLQVPKLGSLGYDREAVRDKYEKMKRQRAYGMQASVRNRSKMTLAPPKQKADIDQKGGGAPKPAVADKKQQHHQQQSERHKANRKHPQISRPKKPQGDNNSTCDLQPLVERHIKEMQASAIIRQHFKCL